MKLNGKEMISRVTISSSRNLLISGATLFAVNHYELNQVSWGIFNRELEPEAFAQIASFIILFLIVNHIVHWFADFTSYTKWFSLNEVNMGTLWGGSAVKGTEAPLANLERRLSGITKSNENAREIVLDLEKIEIEEIKSIQGDRNIAMDLQKMRESISSNHDVLQSVDSEIGGIKDLLDSLDVRFLQTSLMAKFVVFFWYLLVPLLTGIVALFSTWY